jgi:sorbitol/mannitol transport system permease protein
VLTSFKQENAAATNPPTWFFTPTLAQYGQVFDRNVTPFLLNSLMASVFSTLLVVLLATPAAYALSLRRWPSGPTSLFFFISTKMLPAVAALLPIYLLVKQLGMLDNIWTLVILYTSMNLPLAVWMMRSFLLEVPREVLEAGEVDGAGLITSIRKIILPMVSPGLAATALICFIFAWNEFFFAVNLTATNSAPPRSSWSGSSPPRAVPRQALRRRHHASRCRCSSPAGSRRTSWSAACRWAPSK